MNAIEKAEEMRQKMQAQIDRQKLSIDRLVAERQRVQVICYDNQDNPLAVELLKVLDGE